MSTPSRPRILPPRLVFPADALARLPAGLAPDHLLNESVRNDDLTLALDYPLPDPPEDGDSDLLQLLVDGTPVGDIIQLKPYKPGDIIDITLHAANRPLDSVIDRKMTGINYRVTYASGAGFFEDGPRDQQFVTDIVRPGRDSLGPLVFAAGVGADGVTADDLVDDGAGGSYLPCFVKGYDTAAIGDWIVGFIDGTVSTPLVEITAAQVGTDVELRFPRDKLEAFDGGDHAFACRIGDRAGNVSQLSAIVGLRIHLSDEIDDLLPPLVPGFDDGLVTDGDARVNGGVTVTIPGHASIEQGDLIVLRWNAHEAPPVAVDATEVGTDPLKTLTAGYGQVYGDWFAVSGDADLNVPAFVSYRVERGGMSIGEPAQPSSVLVNLFGPGGEDPAPETPEHENLHPPVVQAAGGAPPNVIPADALGQDAAAAIPGMTAGTPPVPAFRPGDRVQLYWNGQAVDSEFVVTAAGQDVIRNVPKAVLVAHSPGQWDVHYTASRALATTPFVNTGTSPVQVVDVKDTADLPGGGKPLAPAKWVEGPAAPGIPDQIDYDKANSGGGTPLRVYRYVNMAANDAVSIAFHGFDSITPPWGDPLPGAAYTLDYVVQAADLVPKRDETVSPPVDAVFIDFLIPTTNLLAIEYGRATFDYAVTNTVGKADAEQAWIYVATRPPSA
ncbi:hypothetical protein QFZ41_000304 [Luteibacter sp. W1I16]|uniref:hypothetical protein n=1 Tax=Luteibacter sp. W1I16 TaxID=3373922 RepID=UPI003D25DCED